MVCEIEYDRYASLASQLVVHTNGFRGPHNSCNHTFHLPLFSHYPSGGWIKNAERSWVTMQSDECMPVCEDLHEDTELDRSIIDSPDTQAWGSMINPYGDLRGSETSRGCPLVVDISYNDPGEATRQFFQVCPAGVTTASCTS